MHNFACVKLYFMTVKSRYSLQNDTSGYRLETQLRNSQEEKLHLNKENERLLEELKELEKNKQIIYER